ncbi:hypothetical protein WMY93_031299 [Mugilogobius chulae]|uniref:Uncharacterized protein n=1 Tax=Mugilogobius chulae TaxID=88201 RepID=A0AAW0MMQ7_9GOBI
MLEVCAQHDSGDYTRVTRIHFVQTVRADARRRVPPETTAPALIYKSQWEDESAEGSLSDLFGERSFKVTVHSSALSRGQGLFRLYSTYGHMPRRAEQKAVRRPRNTFNMSATIPIDSYGALGCVQEAQQVSNGTRDKAFHLTAEQCKLRQRLAWVYLP